MRHFIRQVFHVDCMLQKHKSLLLSFYVPLVSDPCAQPLGSAWSWPQIWVFWAPWLTRPQRNAFSDVSSGGARLLSSIPSQCKYESRPENKRVNINYSRKPLTCADISEGKINKYFKVNWNFAKMQYQLSSKNKISHSTLDVIRTVPLFSLDEWKFRPDYLCLTFAKNTYLCGVGSMVMQVSETEKKNIP